ncbi:MAG: tRNA (guanosine(46)-N7)-methyltransferase TrmB [Planctomycetota bacterium]|nr:MAG: tRNA (guanosine(46)-N7)-methyltransferase TrmB [Planctomycetota bacterium]
MVSTGMKRYRVRSDDQRQLILDNAEALQDPATLFGRRAPLRLEIGFGHGRFLSQMAACHPEEDFIGIEAQPIRVTKTAHWSNKRGAGNVRLLCGEASRILGTALPNACLKRAYVLFPDPWPKQRHRRRRLVNRAFLLALSRVMAPGGRFIFASDTHNYAMQVLSHFSTIPGTWWRNCYLESGGYRFNIPTRFPTVFEEHHKAVGHRIAYLAFERSHVPTDLGST